MFFCLPNEWYSDVPYNIRYISFMVQPLGGFWYIYIYTQIWMVQLGTQTKKLQQKRSKTTCLHANARLGHLFTFKKVQQKLPPQTLHWQRLHPGRLTWNIILGVWKIIFLSKWVICMFHVDLPGCRCRPFERYPYITLRYPKKTCGCHFLVSSCHQFFETPFGCRWNGGWPVFQ